MNVELKAFSVHNFFEPNNTASVIPLNSNYKVSEVDLKRIVNICNQEEVYSLLFSKKLKGNPYEVKNAQGFISWATEGWKTKKYFVFLIKQGDRIIGAIDIKSNNIEGAEIGYWMDNRSKGFMTNVVIELCKFAKAAGFLKLIGFTKIFNESSQRVLIRAGFEFEGKVILEGEERYKYSKDLSLLN